MAVFDDADLLPVRQRLAKVLGNMHGKLRVTDALILAGFDKPSFLRTRIVSRAMADLGWERQRTRIDGDLLYTYERGSQLEREMVLEVGRTAAKQVFVKKRDL